MAEKIGAKVLKPNPALELFEILVSWYLIIILVILQHFWYYWKTVL